MFVGYKYIQVKDKKIGLNDYQNTQYTYNSDFLN